MRNQGFFKGKKVTVVGLARSGLSCANLLFELGADVSVSDAEDNDAVRLNAAKLKSPDINLELGKHTQDFIRGKDIVVVSPGVTSRSLPVLWAGEFGIPVVSEIEIGWLLCSAEIIAVTGSSGKTTVTTLIGKVIEAAGRKPFVCGNIGKPFCAELFNILPDDLVVLEVSSFQLEAVKRFKPKISLFLNFSYNHLDRHKDIEEYLEAKKRIFLNQDKNDYLVLNKNDPVVRGLAKQASSQVVYFEANTRLNPNQAAVLAVGSILGIGQDICMEVFKDFKGLQHRMEYVTEVRGVGFINDSKATTAESCVWALKNIHRPIILIAGGRDKGVDYRLILGAGRSKIKTAVLIGEAGNKIKQCFGSSFAVEEAVSMDEAVNKAFINAEKGDCVLLSPMCSSFDMFSDYEQRGRVFKQAVWELKNKYDS